MELSLLHRPTVAIDNLDALRMRPVLLSLATHGRGVERARTTEELKIALDVFRGVAMQWIREFEDEPDDATVTTDAALKAIATQALDVCDLLFEESGRGSGAPLTHRATAFLQNIVEPKLNECTRHLLKSLGIDFSACVLALGEHYEVSKYVQRARAMASEGTLEVDASSIVSKSDKGAFVMAWLFVAEDDEVPNVAEPKPCIHVHLGSVGNPDHGQDPNRPVYGCELDHVAKVASLELASEAVRAFIERNGLGGGNWSGGAVFCEGKIIGRISYNGRFSPLSAEGATKR